MSIAGRWNVLLLFVGDLIAFAVSLYLTLWLRYRTLPSVGDLEPYLVPFGLLFVLWAIVFYSAGLYSKRLALFPSTFPDALLKTQAVNILFAALFFFLVPSFGIAPKTILVLYLLVSLAVIASWRLGVYPPLSLRRSRERAVLVAEGEEADSLFTEVNSNPRYGVVFISRTSDPSATLFVVDEDKIASFPLHELAREGKQVVSFEELYEEVFDRIPLSRVSKAWLLAHGAREDGFVYRAAKRTLDIVGGLLMGVCTLIVAPIIYLANLLEGRGPLFIVQERFGQFGTRIRVYKFRSMRENNAASGVWLHESENRITRVGAFLRKTSLDEFPQCINLLRGDLSLIGPRSDIWGLGERLAEAIPFHAERYLVKPGITGWAQITQQYQAGNVSPQSIEENRVRLAYDLYYLKHRSLGLDIVIALRTIKKMFFRLSPW